MNRRRNDPEPALAAVMAAALWRSLATGAVAAAALAAAVLALELVSGPF